MIENKMRVLVVDDDKASRIILRSVLSKSGFDVTEAVDGEEALKILEKPDAPKLLLVDWMMPKLNGPALCNILRKEIDAKGFYIIMLTSKSEKADIIYGLEAGANDYLVKPCDNEELKARLNVGKRVIELQHELIKRQKLQGALAMAGTVCHELNQPLQVINGYCEMLKDELAGSNNEDMIATLRGILDSVEQMGSLTRKLQDITRYRVKDYRDGKASIIDLDDSTG